MSIPSHLSPTTKAILQFAFVLIFLLVAIFFAPRPFLSIFMFGEQEKILSGSAALTDYLKKQLGCLMKIREDNLQPEFPVENLPEVLSQLPLNKRTSLFITMVLSQGFSCNELILLQRKLPFLLVVDATNN